MRCVCANVTSHSDNTVPVFVFAEPRLRLTGRHSVRIIIEVTPSVWAVLLLYRSSHCARIGGAT